MSWQPGMTLEDVEKETIQSALKVYNGNKSQTARSLDIAIRTLDYKMAAYAKQADELAEKKKAEAARMAARKKEIEANNG